MSNRNRIVVAIVAAIPLLAGYSFHYAESVAAADKTDIIDELKIFTDVLSIVKRDYVREAENKPLVEGAIKGMLATLDPHSGYLDPEFYQDLQVQTRGEFGGLGIEITIKDGLLIVVSPMDGSPAEKAGIRAGDAIVKIDGKFTKEFSLVDAVKKLRGPKGSNIQLSIQRKGKSDLLEFTLVRDNITVRSVVGRYLGEGFGYVKLRQFMEKTADDMKEQLQALAKKSPGSEIRGLVLDLRNNPGGLLTQAIRVSDFFLEDGVIVYTDGRVESQKQKFFAHARGTEPSYPMIVLVNGGSASASEIVAGALKDHGRALVLGMRTFGKGSVQTITPLQNGGAITLTTALYYTKSGQSIQATGISPDIEMDAASLSENGEVVDEGAKISSTVREGDLPGAIRNPSGKSPQGEGAGGSRGKGKTESGGVQQLESMELGELLKQDAQLARALDLLKTFNVFGSGKAPKSATTAS